MIKRIRLRVADIEKLIKNEEYRSKNIIEIDLRDAKKIHPGLDRVLFGPTGYLHGKDAKAISGVIVGPDGKPILKAYLKIQKISHPSETA